MHLVRDRVGGLWFAWFLARNCSKVERQQMIALLLLILGVLVFFTLYEQTYGSWVTFTDRLLTKNMFPSLVSDSSGTRCRGRCSRCAASPVADGRRADAPATAARTARALVRSWCCW